MEFPEIYGSVDRPIDPPMKTTTERPTFEEMSHLKRGEYIEWRIDEETKRVCVHADIVDDVHIRFTCPFCYTRYKKNGHRRANAKRVVHLHGSCGQHHSRLEDRFAHCLYPQICNFFYIFITPKTKGFDSTKT